MHDQSPLHHLPFLLVFGDVPRNRRVICCRVCLSEIVSYHSMIGLTLLAGPLNFNFIGRWRALISKLPIICTLERHGTKLTDHKSASSIRKLVRIDIQRLNPERWKKVSSREPSLPRTNGNAKRDGEDPYTPENYRTISSNLARRPRWIVKQFLSVIHSVVRKEPVGCLFL